MSSSSPFPQLFEIGYKFISMYENIIFQGILGELNKEQESFLKNKKDGEVAAVPPWIGHPNEEAVKAECLTLSTVSIFLFYIKIQFFTYN